MCWSMHFYCWWCIFHWMSKLHKLNVVLDFILCCTSQEAQMLQASYGKEVEALRQSLLVQVQKLEAAQQRVAELETHLSKKEHLIAEQKKFLEDVKCQAKWASVFTKFLYKNPVLFIDLTSLLSSSVSLSLSCLFVRRVELQASESRYQAQRRITQLLQTELLQLYSRVEMEAPASTCSSSPPGGRADPQSFTDTRSLILFFWLIKPPEMNIFLNIKIFCPPQCHSARWTK